MGMGATVFRASTGLIIAAGDDGFSSMIVDVLVKVRVREFEEWNGMIGRGGRRCKEEKGREEGGERRKGDQGDLGLELQLSKLEPWQAWIK